jgi:hypothetical protein
VDAERDDLAEKVAILRPIGDGGILARSSIFGILSPERCPIGPIGNRNAGPSVATLLRVERRATQARIEIIDEPAG